MSSGALDGVLVVAIEQAVAAPTCTLKLADAGARVIKIEREGGETARHYDSYVKGTATYFAWLNRGKESAVLDLKADDDLALLKNMLRKADVLVQNLAPGALSRMGLTPEVLQTEFPDLIAVSIVGYGQDTDYADMKAYDLLVQAESGICAVTGSADEPAKAGVSIADIATGMNAHAAVLEALIERGRTGIGKQIEIAMFDSMADWMSVPLLYYEHAGLETKRYGMAHASVYPYRPYACKDGSVLIAVQTNAEWQRLCTDVIEQPELAEREDFATNAKRSANRAALDEILEQAFAILTCKRVIERLEFARVAYGRFSEVRDLSNHPALMRTVAILADGQTVDLPRPAGRDASLEARPVPALGEHTDAIRKEFG